MLTRRNEISIVEPAFVSSTRVNSLTARVKGREINFAELTAIATPPSTQAKSTSPRPIKLTSSRPTATTTSSSKKTKSYTPKGTKRASAKNEPKKDTVKGSNTTNTKTFKPLKDLQ
jgi:hypothetical protein